MTKPYCQCAFRKVTRAVGRRSPERGSDEFSAIEVRVASSRQPWVGCLLERTLVRWLAQPGQNVGIHVSIVNETVAFQNAFHGEAYFLKGFPSTGIVTENLRVSSVQVQMLKSKKSYQFNGLGPIALSR